MKRKDELRKLRNDYLLANGQQWDKKLLRQCNMFMKEEFYTERKHARLIISRNDLFKALIGPYIHAFDHELFYGHFSDFFVKGKDTNWKIKRMKEIHGVFPVVMETDYSSFEGSQSRSIQHAIEETLFRHYFKYHPRILELILLTYDPLIYEAYPHLAYMLIRNRKLKRIEPYIHSTFHELGLVGNRKSGEMWTSSGNGFINLVIMTFLAKLNGVKFDGIVEGDDGFFGVSDTTITKQHYADLGFTIKLEYTTDPNELSFCGMRFSRDGTCLISPERLNRLGWCEKKKYFRCKKKTRLQLFKAKCMSLLAEAPNCPITSIFAWNVIHHIKASPKFQNMDWWDLRIYEENKHLLRWEKPVISQEARMDYYEMYGISPEMQVNIEHEFEKDWWNNFYIDMPEYDTYTDGLVAPNRA
jgi:hypothetical protein